MEQQKVGGFLKELGMLVVIAMYLSGMLGKIKARCQMRKIVNN